MLAVATALRARLPNLKFKIFSADGDNMEKVISESGMRDRTWITINRLAPQDVHAHLADCDVALSFRKPAFSTQGVAPIKLGDYLLAGLPIIGSAGVGNTRPLIDAGVFLASDGSNLDEIVDWFCETVLKDRAAMRKTCREIGEAQFSISESVARYLVSFNK